jgi:3-methyladenine DNA glycosylase AlkD
VRTELTAARFVADLVPFVPAGLREEFESIASALDDGMGNGDAIRADIRAGTIFGLAKEYIDLPPHEIVRLLQSPVHDVRVGAVSIMGKQFVRKKTPDGRREELYDTYLAWTRRIDTWSLVDVSGHQVVGGWLVDKPRDVLYELARSPEWWERRLAMWATMAFVRRGESADTFAIAEILVDDPERFVNTVVGGMVREAGKTDLPRLLEFVDRHAATMPRIALRFAVEHQPADVRKRYYAMAAHQAEG